MLLEYLSILLRLNRATGWLHTLKKLLVSYIEYLLHKLDMLACNLSGQIEGVVDFDKYESKITVALPFINLWREAGYKLLKDLTEKSDSVSIRAAKT